jgi:uncharacterized membrane protein YadS
MWIARKEAKETAGQITANTENEAVVDSNKATAEINETTQAEPASKATGGFSLKRAFPLFILWFLCASLFTTVALSLGVSAEVFEPLKTLAKFLIVAAMAAIGLNTNIVHLVKTGGKPLALGFVCWVAIAAVSLGAQTLLGLW